VDYARLPGVGEEPHSEVFRDIADGGDFVRIRRMGEQAPLGVPEEFFVSSASPSPEQIRLPPGRDQPEIQRIADVVEGYSARRTSIIPVKPSTSTSDTAAPHAK
jgi:hypothetical protein